MTDLVTFGEASLRLSPPAEHQLESARRLDVSVSGPESNAAVAAQRLGADATWVSRVPGTPLGQRVVSELKGYDVDVHVTRGGGRQGLTFVEQGGPPRGNSRIEDRADAAATDVGADDLPLDRVRDADGVYVSGATPGLSTPLAGASARLLKAAADAGTLTALGLHYRSGDWDPEEASDTLTGLFPAVDVFVAEEADVATVLDREGQPAELAHALASEWEFEHVALLRERTAVAWHDATVHEYPVVDTDTVDATGVSDAFAGAFVARLLAGADPPDALKTAMATAALARTIRGAVPTVDPADVERVAATIRKNRG